MKRKTVLIYGAGEAGTILFKELGVSRRKLYDVCGFIDDDPAKLGTKIGDIPVLGSGRQLVEIAIAFGVREVLVAVPSATNQQMRVILDYCRAAGLHTQIIPGLAELIAGRGVARQMREVALEDLLGRVPIQLDEYCIRTKLKGETVLVTGAGGSIGSELCRQIARFHPAAVIGFDVSENAVFHLSQNMRQSCGMVKFVAEIGNIQNTRRLRDIFQRYDPSIVYHAAAHKHVPLMEEHVFEAVENNVLRTCNLLREAGLAGVRDFVLISSDKAVYPTSIMGVTKRMAELFVKSLPLAPERSTSVRFGNVLGSNGSVVPLFKKQIAAGGPVTVTHPDMERYFMTIPEAVQLVLQASAMSSGGEVFVLDMGDPVKIVDLAANLIELSGLELGQDIEIEFTGIRPGEKLFEELNTADELMLPTSHDKIKIFADRNDRIPLPDFHVQMLRDLCDARDDRGLMDEIRRLVPEYRPSSQALLHSSVGDVRAA